MKTPGINSRPVLALGEAIRIQRPRATKRTPQAALGRATRLGWWNYAVLKGNFSIEVTLEPDGTETTWRRGHVWPCCSARIIGGRRDLNASSLATRSEVDQPA